MAWSLAEILYIWGGEKKKGKRVVTINDLMLLAFDNAFDLA